MYKDSKFKSLNISNFSPFYPTLSFALLFIIGICVGSILVGKVQYLFEYSSSNIVDFFNIRQNGNVFSIIYNSFLMSFPIYVATFLLGTSFIGCVTAPIIVLLVGFKFGLLTGNLYMSYKLEGIMFNALVLMPIVLSFIFGLFILSKEAFSFSFDLAKTCIKNNKPVNIYSKFRLYCLKSVSTLVCVLVSIIFDVGLSTLFISYFTFI